VVAARREVPGFDPVLVQAFHFVGLRWLPVDGARDAARPPGMVEESVGWAWTSPDEGEPGRTFWMLRLSERLARRASIAKGLPVRKILLEHEDALIRDAIAKLPPADALAVLRASPQLAKRLEVDDATQPPSVEEPS
jgi:hypothetical protein